MKLPPATHQRGQAGMTETCHGLTSYHPGWRWQILLLYPQQQTRPVIHCGSLMNGAVCQLRSLIWFSGAR